MVTIIHHTELFDDLLAMGGSLAHDEDIIFGLPGYGRDRFETAKTSLDDDEDDDEAEDEEEDDDFEDEDEDDFEDDEDEEDDDLDDDNEELDDEDDPKPLRVKFR
jgi:hypothetical protein